MSTDSKTERPPSGPHGALCRLWGASTPGRNLTVLILVGGAVLGLDRWTKAWADRNLATSYHPLPFRVDAAVPVEQALARAFGLGSGEAASLLEDGRVLLLDPTPVTDGGSAAYPAGERSPHSELFVFDRGMDRAPKRVRLRHRYGLRRWLGLLAPGTSAQDLSRTVDESLRDRTLMGVVVEAMPHLDEAEVAALFRRGLVIPGSGVHRATTAEILHPGGMALLTRRIIGVLPEHLRFVYAENRGAAWSFLANANHATRFWFFTVISLLAVLVLLALVLLHGAGRWFSLLAYVAILGGALGNVVDRVDRNFVVDFIDMYWGQKHWPTYNVADIGISIGVVLLLIDALLGRRATRSASGEAAKR